MQQENHPLWTAPGEQVYKAPAAVRDVCKAALAEPDAPNVGNFPTSIAAHISGGEPIGLTMVEKLHDFLEEGKAPEALEKGGATLALTLKLMGGDPAREWARAILEKAGKVEPARAGDPVEFTAKVLKVDRELGLVFGWAIVCSEGGEPYFDTQDDHIPEGSMLKAAADFMANSRVLGDMHVKAEGGGVVFAFPMTTDIAAAFGIATKTTGLMIGVKPASVETLKRFESGEYTGFSIGGRRLVDEDV